MSTEGIQGFYIETRDYRATADVWTSLGFECQFETDHRSGQWTHPSGGPYLFIAETNAEVLESHLILAVADGAAFDPGPALDVVLPFTPQHWGVTEAIVRDPDGRNINLQAPDPA